ncbi:MAG: threonine/serine dehydratase [Alphaproteobacteria bacterium]|nr:threonine/serine dehydratase [Alphaproteobacteria bacterium]
MSETNPTSISLSEIEMAASRLSGIAMRTPLLESAVLNERTGGRILLKAETLQRTGTFKFRGAYNTISQLSNDARARGILAWSSGNHAQGVAAAASLLSTPATIVMPADAPSIKIANTRALGADIVLYDRYSESREDIGTKLADQNDLTIIPPYDDPGVIAGQGTVGLEISQQCQELGCTPDALLVNCGGGGLTAGCAIAMSARQPGCEIYTVEPTGFDDMARSLATGGRQSNPPGAKSICDALLSPTPGALTFPIAHELSSGGFHVSDASVRAAIRFAFTSLKLIVEPGGAVSLAAVLDGTFDATAKTVCITLSGGNIGAEMLSEILLEKD